MKMVMISADDYEKLSNAKKEAEAKMESYKQCVAGYESRIKELTEECDKLKDTYFDMYKKLTADNKRLAKTALNSMYGVEKNICDSISNSLNKSMFDKISELSDENSKLKKENQSLKCDNSLFKDEIEKLRKEIKELKFRNGCLDSVTYTKNAEIEKLKKENEELKATTVSFDFHKKLIEDNERLADENRKLEAKVTSFIRQLNDSDGMRYACENNLKELRQKYEAILKANEKLAAENNRLANDPETIKLKNELATLKKQYRDLNNAYKSQKNELLKLKSKPDDKYDVLRKQYESLYTDYKLITLADKAYRDKIDKIKSLIED